jgi:predicted NBD/HSP70 family sugar kinase
MGPATLRRSNQRAVLTIISNAPGCSNADIARRTGLAPQSVSAVLTDLGEMGLLTRGKAKRSGGRGQPATPLFINPEGGYAIGVEIGWRRLEVALVNIEGKVLSAERVEFDYPDAVKVFGKLAEMVAGLKAKVADPARIVGLGLAMPDGIGDAASLIAPPSGQAELWAKLDPVAAAAEAAGLDVVLVKDGNAACWAEFVATPTPRPGNFAYLLVDTLIAAGIVAEDRLWEGAGGASANLGSMLVGDVGGESRFVHEIASVHALRQRLGAVGLDLSAATADEPSAAAQVVLDSWIDDAALALAQTVLNARTVLEFEFAVIDSELPVPILLHLIERLRGRLVEIPSLGGAKPAIRQGHLGRSGAAQGAAFIRLYRKFFSRELAHMDG